LEYRRIKPGLLSVLHVERDMVYYKVVFFIFVILQQFLIAGARSNDDDPELLWSNEDGNSQNTYRIVPSMVTHYSKMPWIYEYNLTSQDTTEFGLAAGINGDLYFFLGKARYHRGKCFEVQFHKTINKGLRNVRQDISTFPKINGYEYYAYDIHRISYFG
jgi:hypothetical protein